ncbi:MAG: TolC family protein [Bacteroidales bacterium]
MKKYLIIGSALVILPILLMAQNSVDSVLSQIEKNNTTLSALGKSVEAQKIGNKTGIYLQNPDIGFNYLWSDPTSVGNRTDISIKQSFDFPTAYGYRRQISEFRNNQAELEYQKQHKNIMLEARHLCAEIVYSNALLTEYQLRLDHARELEDAYKVMFEKGETSVLESNKAQLNLLMIKKEFEAITIERSTNLQQLTALNGGQPLELNLKSMVVRTLPAEFEQWYKQAAQTNPDLLWLNQEIQLSQQQEKLNRALTLPKAYTGYMSEKRTGENFQGITIGVTIPLWENKNTVKYAKAKTIAWQGVEADNNIQYYNQLKIQFEKAVSLQKTVNEYRQSLQLYQNIELLNKALEKGEISLLNYLMEISLTYSTVDRFLKAENELNKAITLLYQYQD